MIQRTARTFFNYVLQKRSFKSGRKILVIESDDWGTIRMPSTAAFKTLLKKGYPVDRCIYSTNDCLETSEDLSALCDVLGTIVNREGKSPVVTLNMIVGNPDFEKIRLSEFSQYHLEPFTQTLSRTQGSDDTLKMYRKGMAEALIRPQFHGREHVNINRWLHALQDPSANVAIRQAFDLNMFTIHTGVNASCRSEYLDAFGFGYDREYETHDSIVTEGLNRFEEIFGFRSESFIAPCYVWNSELENVLATRGVRYIQGARVQRNASKKPDKWFTRKWHFTGEKNKHGQIFLVRNVLLEPSENTTIDWATRAFLETQRMFESGLPAIVSAHRVNFVGALRMANKDWGLKNLNQYLRKVVATWPDVEFLTSDQLGKRITNKIRN